MKQTVLNVRLSTEDKEELEKFSKQVDMPMSQIARIAIKNYIKANQQEENNN